ncbi:hypothetical protein ONS95_002716 [Cadophora gregata]|uniref:uncharacterized protein n=1 Tax=Cadophora gregata TaxID=51156 RepID=UPI0026DC2D81|nr:uncharacterized protein ONS95_002716 [Cadophora gregata]KAK0110056.1 hypothetical protein ONS95_002716 [Cadophora gregata]KAK0110323.1 hypothetical protein ONS96_001939 [Cadophora gregata f. sp. sojae]
MITRLPAYDTALTRLKNKDKNKDSSSSSSFLDVGCMLGQDLRRLVYDGAPSESLTGVDIASHWDVGFEMFRDTSTFHAQFIECDILAPNPELAALEGTFDIIYIAQVLHQWGWEGQLAAVKQLVKLSRPKANAMVFGFQLGQETGGEKVVETAKSRHRMFLQGVETFRELWRKAGEETDGDEVGG